MLILKLVTSKLMAHIGAMIEHNNTYRIEAN